MITLIRLFWGLVKFALFVIVIIVLVLGAIWLWNVNPLDYRSGG